jgi:hypothetical protein
MTSIIINPNDGKLATIAVGGETQIDFDFPIFDAEHVQIFETAINGTITELVKDTDYTVPPASVGVQAGGVINLDPTVYPTGATAGHIFNAYLNVPYSRVTDFNQAGDFFADTLNQELDLIAQQLQQVVRDMKRSPIAPVDTTVTEFSLPDPADRRALLWNGTTGQMVNSTYDPDEVVNLSTTQAGIATAQAGIATAAAADATAQVDKLSGTSTTSIAIGTGTKVFTTQADKLFNGENVRIYSSANVSNFMDGIATYSGTTLSVDVTTIGGSGTFTDWVIKVNGAKGATGPAGAAGLGSVVEDTSPQLGGFLDPNGNYIGWAKGADIASASPLVIVTDGNYFNVTGTTNFSAMTVATNRKFTLRFTGILTITHGSGITIPASANYTTAVGDIFECQSTTANTVVVTGITKVDGTALVSSGSGGGYTATTVIGNVNWDSHSSTLTAGIYKTTGTYTQTQSVPLMGLAHEGILEVYRIDSDTNRIVQKWTEASNGEVWQRATSNGGTTWSMWSKIVDFNAIGRAHNRFIPKDFDTAFTGVTTNQKISGLVAILSGTNASVTGSYSYSAGVVKSPKAGLLLKTGTTATGNAALNDIIGGVGQFAPSATSGFCRFECSVAVSALSTSAQRYYLFLGGINNGRTDTNISGFSYIDTENSGNWVCINDSSGTETVTNTTKTVAVDSGNYFNNGVVPNTLTKLRIECENNTVYRYYINDELVATHTTNITSNASVGYIPIKILKTVGTTSTAVAFADYSFQLIN